MVNFWANVKKQNFNVKLLFGQHLEKFGLLFNVSSGHSVSRFYAIVCPLASGKAAHFMKILLGTAWIVSILSAAPQVGPTFY